MVWFDLGNFWDNPTSDGLAKTEGLVEAMNRLGYAAANVGERDLVLGYDEFVARTAKASFPFVSANIVREDTKAPVFAPYTVLEVPGRAGQKWRLGVLGLVRFNPVFLKAGPEKSNLVIVPPLDAARRYVPELRERSDLVVVLAALHRDDAHVIAREVPGIDLVLGSYGAIYSSAMDTEGGVPILYAGHQGQRVGETRIFLDAGSKLSGSVSFLHTLTARYPSDPEMERFVGGILSRLAGAAAPAASSTGGGT